MKNVKKVIFIVIIIFIIAYFLNFVWEFLHYPLYTCKIPLGRCAVVSSFRDALIILGFYVGGIFLFKRTAWISNLDKKRIIIMVTVSFLVAFIIELQGIYLKKWEYSALMPIIPVIDVGLSPVLQMIFLPLLTFYICSKIIKNSEGKEVKHSFIPAAKFNTFTPFFDFICSIIGLGKRYRKRIIEVASLPNKRLRVLDAGCGSGSLAVELKQLKNKLELFAVDADGKILSYSKEKASKHNVKIYFKKAFIQKLHYPKGYFDFVYSSLVLHHLKTDEKQRALDELYRVLKKGGSFLLVDFGKPRNVFSSVFSLFSVIFEEGLDNYKGKIPEMLLNAGFKSVDKVGEYRYNIHFLIAKKIGGESNV